MASALQLPDAIIAPVHEVPKPREGETPESAPRHEPEGTPPRTADNARANAEQPRLGVTDIEFRAEVIYFLVVDRFHDGDPNNNAGNDAELSDPERKDWGKYWGGDLQGVIDKLDYIQSLGATAIWMTPLFEQIEAMAWDSAPIHGYWTRDFKRINVRWVSGQDEVRVFARNDTTFDRLIAEMHRRKMKLVLDIVCNHSSPDADGRKGQLFDDGVLVADFNDDRDHWYHHYGPVTDWESAWQIQNCELAGLATFNENNVAYRNYVKSAIKAWLDKGVDALRIDTVKHMPLWFWQEFTSDMVSHKPDLFMFGEWIYNHPGNDESVEFANNSGMSVLDFGLCMAIRSALASGDPRGFLAVHEVFDLDYKYRNATDLVTFIENHDMPRFQSLGASQDMLHLATVLILLCRGIPCLYYGTEQYLHDDTNGGADPYNRPMMASFGTDTPIFEIVQKLSALRRANPSVQFGSQWTQHVTPEVFCWSRRYRDARCFVALNRGGATLLQKVGTDLPDGAYTCVLTGKQLTVAGGHIAGLALAEHEAIVLEVSDVPASGKGLVRFQVNDCPTQPGDVVAVIGNVEELGCWDVSRACRLEFLNGRTWHGGVAFEDSAGKQVTYKYVVLRDGDQNALPRRENRTTRRRIVPSSGFAKWRDIWEE